MADRTVTNTPIVIVKTLEMSSGYIVYSLLYKSIEGGMLKLERGRIIRWQNSVFRLELNYHNYADGSWGPSATHDFHSEAACWTYLERLYL